MGVVAGLQRLGFLGQRSDGRVVGNLLGGCIGGGIFKLALEGGNLFESGSLNPQADRAMVAQTIRQFAGIADLALTMNRIRPAERYG